jgi:maltodextrin utilization protein YvdJ
MAEERPPFGCGFVVIGINALLMVPFAAEFVRGSFSGVDQMLWYRGGSLAFVLAGVVLPIAALLSRWRRSFTAMVALSLWLPAVLLLFVGYALTSDGGM